MPARFPAWRACLSRSAETSPYRRWLTCPGLLTAALQGACTHFAVQPLRQQLAALTADEAQLLGLPPRQLAWVREVLLLCDGVPCVFARSVLPLAPPAALDRSFHGLGSRSLGRMLFSQPTCWRSPLQFARITQPLTLYQRASAAGLILPAALWARRAVSRPAGKNGKGVLVTEVFLPQAMARLAFPSP